MQELHDGPAGGHSGADTTAHKIIHARYYWPTLFRDTHEYVRKCQSCQTSSGRQKKSAFPLQSVNIEQPFEQWGLDIIWEITPHSSKQHRHILIATDYFTKWIELIPSRKATDAVIIGFLETNILSRFGCPTEIITDNAAAFKSRNTISFCNRYHITLGHSTAYYPQGNGLVESSNKSLINIIKKLLEENKKTWHKKLINAL